MKIQVPSIKKLSAILPDEPTLLMGAGPVPIPNEVAEANKLVISHLGEPMNSIVAGLQQMSQYLFQTTTTKIFGVSGPASACMEMAVTSLLYPGRKVLVLNLGTFSNRFAELSRGVGADVVELHPQPLSPFRTADVKAALEKEKFDVLTVVQGETSCGIRNVELEQIVKLAKSMGVRTIVDTVCTLSTMPLLMDDWGIDICVTGGQKGLSSVAGVSLIAFSEDAYAFVEKREVRMPHWCLDPRRAFKFWCKHEYHYTAPVNGINALYEALRLICEETLEKRQERHEQSSKLLQRSLEKMGLTLYAPEECRLNSVVAINNPESVNAKELIAYLKQTYNVEISGAFGLNIVRIGQMGEQCRPQNVKRVLEALGKSYVHFGVPLDLSVLEAL